MRYAKRWADLHQVKFPPIPEFKENEEVKELYILQDENDPLCPVIMHFVLVNKDFKRFTKPGWYNGYEWRYFQQIIKVK